MYWTHVTLPLSDLDGSIKFFTETCGLAVIRDRRLEGGNTVWLGPKPTDGTDPEFALVAYRGEVKQPLDHFDFQCETREQVTAIADAARALGTLIEGPIDHGGSVGYYAVLREPSGHLVEFTHGQPMRGLRQRAV